MLFAPLNLIKKLKTFIKVLAKWSLQPLISKRGGTRFRS